MSRIIKTVEVTVTVEFDYADEEAGEVVMAIPNAFDMFNASQDTVTLSWEGENLIDRVEFDSAGYR